MIPGWDYSRAKANGRNVFFFRDTDHTSGAVQELLLGELEDKVKDGFFSIVFTEGCEGIYRPSFLESRSEEELKDALNNGKNQWTAVELLAYRCREGLQTNSLSIFGVDSNSLRREAITTYKELVHFTERHSRGERFTDEEVCHWSDLLSKRGLIHSQRNVFSAGVINNLLVSDPISAGLVYGEKHYEGIVSELIRFGIGCISFFPGQVELNFGRSVGYIKRL